MRSLEEFKTEVCKRKSKKKKFKVSNSWGIYDAYKHVRKNKWYNIGRHVTEYEYYKIVREVNKLLANEIANGREVIFPCRMGKLELRKLEKGVSIVNNKLKITYPVDWNETLKLWYEDEQARKDKTLLRKENKYVYRVRYCKYNATYENKLYYEFVLNRFIKKALKENIEQRKVDTLW